MCYYIPMTSTSHSTIYDLFIVGGGINGCGIARDASGRGLRVFLCEQFDLANETSSRSSKMIHGGLRYLEYYEFRLVREALEERDVLLQIAPHLVQPLQLIIPHNRLQRPAWLLRLVLLMYDHLGFRWGKRSHIPKSYGVSFKTPSPYSAPLQSNLTRGFCYYDCKVDDARLVALNALDAQQRGAVIQTRCQLIAAEREDALWRCTVRDQHGATQTLYSRSLINAAGPWVDNIVTDKLHLKTRHHVELVKGSHIVFPKLYEGNHAYLLQNDDKRVIFVIPYHNDFTMVGTTDVEYQGDPTQVTVSPEEREYLCTVVNRYFKRALTPSEIVNEWSGVRPLQADEKNNPSAVTRDYSLELDALPEHGSRQAPLLSIFGGKITTYRQLALHALKQLAPYFPQLPGEWTDTAPLPGGDVADIVAYAQDLVTRYPQLPSALLQRYAYSYGTRSALLLEGIATIADLGQDFGAGLYAKEVDYLVQYEWAQTAEDILWRRSKLGLFGVDAIVINQYLKR